MEMEVRNRILRQINLSTLEPKIPHFRRLHNDLPFCQILEVEGSWIDGFEEGYGGAYAGLKFGEGGFFVFEGDGGEREDAHCKKFRGVRERLNLVGKAEIWLAFGSISHV